jgi:hypothetical protein
MAPFLKVNFEKTITGGVGSPGNARVMFCYMRGRRELISRVTDKIVTPRGYPDHVAIVLPYGVLEKVYSGVVISKLDKYKLCHHETWVIRVPHIERSDIMVQALESRRRSSLRYCVGQFLDRFGGISAFGGPNDSVEPVLAYLRGVGLEGNFFEIGSHMKITPSSLRAEIFRRGGRIIEKNYY